MNSYQPTDPLGGIIITAHNEGDYLNQCIQSCIEQTYQDVEICGKMTDQFKEHLNENSRVCPISECD